jgi:hypothetical protein
MTKLALVLLGLVLFVLGLNPLFTNIAPTWVGLVDLAVAAISITVGATLLDFRPSLARAFWPLAFATILGAVWLPTIIAGRQSVFISLQLGIAVLYVLIGIRYLASHRRKPLPAGRDESRPEQTIDRKAA